MDPKNSTGGNLEPICAPLVRLEATLHPVGGVSSANGKEHGETEACPMAPLVKIEAELKPCAPDHDAATGG